MNLLAKPEAIDIIRELGEKRVNGKVVRYSMVCGIDWRFLTLELAEALKASRFQKIRLAWDWSFHYQVKIKEAIKMLKKAGYRGPRDVMVFMVCNWKIPYKVNLRKLELLKVWNVQVSDCWFDNQLPPNVKPVHWTEEQIKDFRRICRRHNQLVSFGVDPEYINKVKDL